MRNANPTGEKICRALKEVVRSVGKLVAVEEGLTQVVSVLREEGFEVVNLTSDGLKRASALVVGGIDRDFLDIQRASARVPVIEARGKTAEEVLREVRARAW